jgi:hypothetical protein
MRKSHLLTYAPERIPMDARQDVPNEERVQVDSDNLELRVARVQRERGRAGLAGFACAANEIERDDLHPDRKCVLLWMIIWTVAF